MDYNFTINSMDKIDLYDILQINKNASDIEIKKAYRKLILKYHPDKSKEKNNDMFIKIQYAYEILSNKESRKQYDNKINYSNNLFNNYKSDESKTYIIINLIKKIGYIIGIKEYLPIINIIEEKIKLNQLDISTINPFNFYHKLNSILDIEIKIEFSLEEIYFNKSRIIEHRRISREKFTEEIFPLDKIQLYEEEGEIINLTDKKMIGNLRVKIEIKNEMIVNNINYYIVGNDLYGKISKSNINNNNLLEIIFIDGKKYLFTMEELDINVLDIGIQFKIADMGLYYNENVDELVDMNLGINIIRGNLFFILLF